MSDEECAPVIENIMKDFNINMPILLSLYTLMDTYDALIKYYDKKIRKINTVIFSMFLFCWSSILYMSFKIELLNPIFINLYDKVEPFSGLII
jgi:hypothetical protein